MSVIAVVLAAGSGARFGQDKLSISLRGKPVWRWSVDSFLQHPEIDHVGLVAHEAILDSPILADLDLLFTVRGGASRPESCKIAVDSVPETCDLILIHDAARPLIDADAVSRLIEASRNSDAAALGMPARDSIRQVNDLQSASIPRSEIWQMQTPQACRYSILREAFSLEDWESATDEMELMERLGSTVKVVEGSVRHHKITTPEDFGIVESMMGPAEVRNGLGYDIHPFSDDASRTLWLGGVAFPGERALDGHSDADVVIHAVVDALFGAVGAGDIGEHFPNTDSQWKNKPSVHFLTYAGNFLRQNGWKIGNIDVTVIAEVPKILPRAKEMKIAMGAALEIEPERINLKATTNEKLGAIGRKEGIAAMATATVVQAN